jgi:hypothetical protein
MTERLQAAIHAMFADHDATAIMSILDGYGVAEHERERERVQLAILKLSAGDEDKLIAYVKAAKVDYRDVLMWADEPRPSAEQAAEDLAIVQRILRIFGKKT